MVVNLTEFSHFLPDDDNGMKIEDYQGYKLKTNQKADTTILKIIKGDNRTLYLILVVPGSGTTSQKRQ